MPRVKGHPLARMIIYSVIAAVIGTVAVLLLDWFPTPASTVAGDIDTLYDVLLVVSVPIFVLVMAVAIYSVVKFRARPGDLGDGAPIHGNTRLEVIWVTIPFILVTALAVYGWIVLDDLEAKEPNTLVVDVRAQQFAWRFAYPGENNLKSNQLVLPKDRPVEFRVTTNDVIHDFWVPQFRLKTDTVPGLTTKLRVTPNRLGTLRRGLCRALRPRPLHNAPEGPRGPAGRVHLLGEQRPQAAEQGRRRDPARDREPREGTPGMSYLRGVSAEVER